MLAEDFYQYLKKEGIDSFYGVPDSLLKSLNEVLEEKEKNYYITPNEGSAVAMASGYHLATSKIAAVYMQNSGLGNAINPLLSLADDLVYGIPMILLIGYRGQPGVKDEPQHKRQGEVTVSLLETMHIPYEILKKGDDLEKVSFLIKKIKKLSQPCALVIEKDVLTKNNSEDKPSKSNDTSNLSLSRKEAIESVLNITDEKSIFVSTTGKLSRELFSIRERKNEGHNKDFLVVGSMGHTSAIAWSIAMHSDKTVYCLDGDGSMIMHMGNLGMYMRNEKQNLKYILFNNGSHESVGGMPTFAFDLDMKSLSVGLGFKHYVQVSQKEDLDSFLKENIEENYFLEIKINKNTEAKLGRPHLTPKENKYNFMKWILK